jgi:hypothetical protein
MNAAPIRARLFMLALCAIGLWLVWTGQAPVDVDTASPPIRGSERSGDERGRAGQGDAATPASRALTGIDDAMAQEAPLLMRIPALRHRAEAGDARAACRLALELSACRAAAKRDDLSMTMEYVAATSEHAGRDPRVIDSIAEVREAAADAAPDCAGLETEGETDVVALLQAAAATGNARHRVIAALTQPDGSLLRLPRGPVHPLPMDPWVLTLASQFYADHALRYLDEGLRQRDPLALEGLILVHAPDVLVPSASTDAAFRLPNPRRFATLALLAEQVYGTDMLGSQTAQLLQRTLETFPEPERSRIEAEARRWARGWRASAASAPPPEAIDAQAIEALCR